MDVSLFRVKHEVDSEPALDCEADVGAASGGGGWGETIITHGVLRAPKADGTHSIMLVVDYEPGAVTPTTGAASGLSIGLTLLAYLEGRKWLAKDILLVCVPRGPERDGKARSVEAFERWVHRYHAPGDDDFARGGQILVSLALEIPRGEPYTSLSIIAGGQYALSPNLDVVSVTARLMRNFGVPLTVCESATTPAALLDNSAAYPSLDKLKKGLLRCMFSRVTSADTGYHGPLLTYGVDALTVRAVTNDKLTARGWNQQSSLAVVRAVEGTLRAFNNLIEKLHHSTNLYILASTLVFTTMEKYVYGCLLLGLPLLLYAFALIYFANPDRLMHAFGVLGGIYAVCLTALLLPNALHGLMGWGSLAVWVWGLTVLAAAMLLLLRLFPYLNTIFPPDPAAFALREERLRSERYPHPAQNGRRHSRAQSLGPPAHPLAPSIYDSYDSLLPPIASRPRLDSALSTPNSVYSSAANSAASSTTSSPSHSPQPSPRLISASSPALQDIVSLPTVPPPPPSREWECERYYWVDYASFKAIAMITVVLSLSPLGILNFSVANLAFLIVAPLLALVAPFERPEEPTTADDKSRTPLRRKLQHKLALATVWMRLVLGGVVLVILSPPSLLFAAAVLAETTPMGLASALLARLPVHSQLHITQVFFLVYCPAFASAGLLYTLKLFSGPRPTAIAPTIAMDLDVNLSTRLAI
jgi:hypothetical protein